MRESCQLIVITHQKRTTEIADALYGVSMRQARLRFGDAEPDQGEGVGGAQLGAQFVGVAHRGGLEEFGDAVPQVGLSSRGRSARPGARRARAAP